MRIEGSLAQKDLPDGRYIAILPLTYHRSRLVIGTSLHWHDDGW